MTKIKRKYTYALHKDEHKLRTLAQTDPVMSQLFGAYDAGHFRTWEEFLVNSVLTMAEVKKSLHNYIEKDLIHSVPPILISRDDAEAFLDTHLAAIVDPNS